MIDYLIAELGEKLDLTAEELADIIWLSLIRQQGIIADSKASQAEAVTVIEQSLSPKSEPVAGNPPRRSQTTSLEDRLPINVPNLPSIRDPQTTPLNCLPIKVANPPSIRDPLAFALALRPLKRQVPSGQIEGLDEQATAQQIAEAFIWQPIVKPALEPWLELVLVADESASMLIWRQTVLEFRKLLQNYGMFRDVQLWGLHWENPFSQTSSNKGESIREEKRLCLLPGIGSEVLSQALRQPEELLDPSGRRLILLITDCVSAYWQDKVLIKTLKLWSQHSPVAIAQVLPEWLWVRTALRGFEPVQLVALEPGVPNSQLAIDWNSVWQAEPDIKTGVCVPVVPLEPDSVLTWSQMVMGQSEALGYWMQAFPPDAEEPEPASLSSDQRIERFRVMSSPVAQRLMGLVAASPVITLAVIRLIQETLLPNSQQMNVAEVLLGGLLKPISPPQLRANPDEVEYHFVDDSIRKLLLAETPVNDTVRVLSEFVERQFGMSLDEFVAEVRVWSQSEDVALVEKTRPFATVTASVLKRKGGKYREFVQQIERQYQIALPEKSVGREPVSDKFEFDVFLCYNSEDKPEVIEIANSLRRQGIKPWLDEWELPPGQRWQPILEQHIEQISSAAVFIGNGLGPWQDEEKDFILRELNKRSRPIIPVLLSTVPQQRSSLPDFLAGRTWVDFRQVDPDPMSQLNWGITGRKRSRKQKFMTIYSYKDENERPDNSMVIVLPAYDMKKVEVTQQSTSNTLKQQATENLSRSETKAAIKNDVVAGVFIASSFTQNWLPTPQISWDQDQEEINVNDTEKRTHILIGLSNSRLDLLNNESIPGKYFSIETFKEEDNFNSFIIKCGCFDRSNNLLPIEQWHFNSVNGMRVYAVFAKFKFDNKTIIVCGGITGTCTNKAAWYISENWQSIYDRLEYEKGGILAPDDSFAVVIEVPRDEQSNNFAIERVCIKKIT